MNLSIRASLAKIAGRSGLALLIASLSATVAHSPAFAQPKNATLIRKEITEHVTNSRQKGWEQPLTIKDPNLSHWHWEPINNSARSIQVRNIYGTTPIKKVSRPLAYKIPLPVAPDRTGASQNESVNAKLSTNGNPSFDASGKLMRRQVDLNQPQTSVYTYNSTFHTAPSISISKQSQTNVAGKLIRSKTTNL